MKYGLVIFKKTENVGDDILSYAAERFLPSTDYVIDREAMDTFCPETKEKVAVICNGWFLHAKTHWPPSPFIHPLFVGIHFSEGYSGRGAEFTYLDEMGAAYLREHGPIGCRDNSTLDLMEKRGISAYFSGCLTLTLGQFPDVPKSHKIVLLDVDEDIRQKAVELFGEDHLQCESHLLEKSQKNLDWGVRRSRVERYLKKYQAADMVITTRLHGALPCLALGTKVLLIIDDKDPDTVSRMGSYLEYVPTCSKDMFSRFTLEDISNIENPDAYKVICQKLRDICTTFVETCTNASAEGLPEIMVFDSLYKSKVQWQRRLLPDDCYLISSNDYAQVCNWGNHQEQRANALEEKIKLLEEQIHFLNSGENPCCGEDATQNQKNDNFSLGSGNDALEGAQNAEETELTFAEREAELEKCRVENESISDALKLAEEERAKLEEREAELQRTLHISQINNERTSNLLKIAEEEKARLWGRINKLQQDLEGMQSEYYAFQSVKNTKAYKLIQLWWRLSNRLKSVFGRK